MATANIEPIAGCLRIWIDNDKGYGDLYDVSATVRWVDNKTIEVMGLDKPVTVEMCNAIRVEAGKWGADKVGFIRLKNGKSRTKWFTSK